MGNYFEKKTGKVRLDLSLAINTLGAPKGVEESLKFISKEDLENYHHQSDILLKRISNKFLLKKENILLTNGSDAAIELILSVLLTCKDSIAINIPIFPRHIIVSKNFPKCRIKLFRNINKLPKSKFVILCSPNNPTTQEIGEKDLTNLISKNKDKMFLIDAVYSEFGKWKPEKFLKKFKNIIILKSFSKSLGLAGLRIGVICSNPEIVKRLKEASSLFAVSSIQQKILLHMLKHFNNHVEKSKKFFDYEWKFIKSKLGDNAIRESNVPFFLLKVPINSIKACKKLKKKGIFVVDCKEFDFEENFLRVSIKKRKENLIFIEEVKKMFELNNGGKKDRL